ncbi:MAG: PAS domain S-box protein [Alphaproteobacteria bacterium]|nr:MAG: PAS domain S-box protein [Alphaproteobacteria bacterium]
MPEFRARTWLVLLGLAMLAGICPTAAWAQSMVHIPSVSSVASPAFTLGIFYGIMLTACLYLFFIWIVVRDSSHIFLISMLLSLSVNMGALDLFMGENSYTETMSKEIIKKAAMALFYASSVVFTMKFLEFYNKNSPMQIVLQIALLMFIVLFMWAILFSPSFYINIGILKYAIILGSLVILWAGALAFIHRVPSSETHLLAFAILFVGMLEAPLKDMGLLNVHLANLNLMHFTTSLAAMVFAVVIASQFANRQEAKERALAISNERFSLAAQGANEGLYEWNLTDGNTYFSDRLKSIIGSSLPPGFAGLRCWLHLIYPPDARRVLRIWRQFRRSNRRSISIEYRLVRQDGRQRWLYTTAVALRDHSTGRILRLVGSTGDISEKKRAEVALKASETRFRSIAEAHPVPVIIIRSSDGALLFATESAAVMFGIPIENLREHSLRHFCANQEDLQPMLHDLASGRPAELPEITLLRSDSTPLPASLLGRPIIYEREAAAVVGINDLSERKHAEEEIAKQREALLQSEKMAALGGLLAGVAHELNNPLSVAVGQATLLLEGSSDAKIIGRAEKIKKAVERCTRIVRSFLALARRKPPERHEVKLNPIVEGVVELLGYQLRTNNVTLKLEMDPNLPTVYADGDQLSQVVTNLVVNSQQAMQALPGAHTLNLVTRSLPQTGEIEIVVSDNGPGIPPEIRTRIFEPFFTTKPAGSGTGIGLSLSLNIVESHGGRLLLDETPGGGATFIIRLPVYHGQEDSYGDDVEAAKPAIAPIASMSPKRLLLVDDEIEIAQTLSDLLAPDGHSCDIAENGEVALQKLATNGYDLIVSDLRMPVLDGPGLYDALQKNFPMYLRRILFATGDTLSPHVHDFLARTAVPVIDKPYTPQDVRRAIARQLQEAENLPSSPQGST